MYANQNYIHSTEEIDMFSEALKVNPWSDDSSIGIGDILSEMQCIRSTPCGGDR